MGVIEQELPSGGFMPLMPLAGSANEVIEAEIASGTPPAGKTIGSLRLPTGALVGVVVRRGKLLHPDEDTKLEVGDRVIVFSATTSASERAYAIEPRAARSSRATGTRTRGALRRRRAASGASTLGGPRRVRLR